MEPITYRELEERSKRLQPARNKRHISPCCCMTCKHLVNVSAKYDTNLECEREGGSVSEENLAFTVCDLYSRGE